MNPRLKDIVRELKARGRNQEAEYYEIVVPFDLSLLHDIDPEKILEMTIEQIETLYRVPQKPAKYAGWDFLWGEWAFAEDDSAGNR